MGKLEPGTMFGKDFRIVRPLREGGMGAVYVAEQLSTGKQRALKVMAPQLATDLATRERFVLEAHAGSRIESDHVVEIVTAGIDEGTGAPFLVMELLKGEELADAAARIGPMPLGDVAELLSQIGHALEQAHAQGIVHRDLKPENVFLATSRRRDVSFTAKILDFGIAKLVEDSIKKTGTQPLGTPLFMAPEQTDRKGPIRPATDVWALGLIAFKLLSGRDYWIADGSLASLLREICMDPMPFATARAKELSLRPIGEGEFPVAALPPGFDSWFARCVNRDIDARFRDAGEAVRAFAELVTADAPRGALVMATTAPVDSGAVAKGATTANTEALASTRLATNAAVVQTAPGARPGKGVWVIAAVAATCGVAGGGLYYWNATPTPARSTPTSASTAPRAPAAVPAPASTCPDGMAFIAGGSMFMGTRDLGPDSDSTPPHPVKVSSFCLDRTEVTTKRYMSCAEKGDCEKAPKTVNWAHITKSDKDLYSTFCTAAHPERGDHPINCVAWSMADGFCKHEGARLPTEAEWEFAARGPSQRDYPWGDAPPGPDRLNGCGTECAHWFAVKAHEPHHPVMYDASDGFEGTAPVGSFDAGASAAGVLDLAGNVLEWTADWYGPYASTAEPMVDPKGAEVRPGAAGERVVRGGAFNSSDSAWARPAYRWKTNPETYNHGIGFRCAATPK